MNSKRFLIKIRYLGFRYHGIQKQPKFLTIQGQIESALIKKFPEESIKIRFASRTDAKVSVLESYFLVMFKEPQQKCSVEEALNILYSDLEILDTKMVADNFIIQKAIGVKEYHYFFSFGAKSIHPFSSPFMTNITENLDLEIMIKGASEFVGTHFFKNYSYKSNINAKFERKILTCEIVPNDFFTASFFPEKSFVLKISSQGFLRGQVRLIVGVLFRLGMQKLSLEELIDSLNCENPNFVKWLAPSAGLILAKTELE
jgi:tRNA pseudouridine38-40 synthase